MQVACATCAATLQGSVLHCLPYFQVLGAPSRQVSYVDNVVRTSLSQLVIMISQSAVNSHCHGDKGPGSQITLMTIRGRK